jgi:hypothetical protein
MGPLPAGPVPSNPGIAFTSFLSGNNSFDSLDLRAFAIACFIANPPETLLIDFILTRQNSIKRASIGKSVYMQLNQIIIK